MNLNEARHYLGLTREQVVALITTGVTLPRSGRLIQLSAEQVGNDYEITEEALDAYFLAWEEEQPGRHPSVHIRRALRTEAGHRCAICRDSAPLQFHHMVDWGSIRHHDPKHMLAVCGTCHSQIELGMITYPEQDVYKQRLQTPAVGPGHPLERRIPLRMEWDDLRDVITSVAAVLDTQQGGEESAHDFSYVTIEKKNKLNEIGDTYFVHMRDYHEPHFGRIAAFLGSNANAAVAKTYHRIVTELGARLAASRGTEKFEVLLLEVFEQARESGVEALSEHSDIVLVLLSFMYFNCDIGKK